MERRDGWVNLGESRKARVNESSSELGKIRERDRSYESWES